MYEKTILIPHTNKKYSYYELASSENQSVLEKLNKLKGTGENIAYCTCNGKNLNKAPKMLVKTINNGSQYILANYPKTHKHNPNCPKFQVEKDLVSKGRLSDISNIPAFYSFKDDALHPNKFTSETIKYNTLFLVGEFLLSRAHNDYTETYNRNGIAKTVLSELYEYYNSYCKGTIPSPFTDLNLNNESQLNLKDITFNPKWITCDDDQDKTYSAIKNFIITNKNLDIKNMYSREYILLKYDHHEDISDNLVKITLYCRGKNTKENYDKYICIYANKFLFYKKFNAARIKSEDNQDLTDYYISTLVHLDNKKLIVDDMSFIPTYPNYCIPVENKSEIEFLTDALNVRDRVLINKLAKLDRKYDIKFGTNVPDYILKNKDNSQLLLIEIFDTCTSYYYKHMLSKTLNYEKLCRSSNYEFLGYYKNLGWKAPTIKSFAFGKFKTLDDLYSKVENKVKNK